MDSKIIGKIISVIGQITKVAIESNQIPFISELLTAEDDPSLILEVIFQEKTISTCLIISDYNKIHRGIKVVGSGQTLSVPVGKEILGRAINLYGTPQDGLKLPQMARNSIYANSPELATIDVKSQILETGIKAIDFFTPIPPGGKINPFNNSFQDFGF